MPRDAISSGYCCEVAPITPSATFCTPGQPPSTETISTSFSRPMALQRLVGAGGGGFVDGVDDVDRRILAPAGSPSRVRPPSSLPAVTSWPTMRGSVSSPQRFGSPRSMPKPCRKPWSRSTSTVGWLTARSSMRDLGVGRLVAQLGGGPLADQFAGLEVVGGEGRVGRVDRIERRVERDHQQARVARLLDRGPRWPRCRRR